MGSQDRGHYTSYATRETAGAHSNIQDLKHVAPRFPPRSETSTTAAFISGLFRVIQIYAEQPLNFNQRGREAVEGKFWSWASNSLNGDSVIGLFKDTFAVPLPVLFQHKPCLRASCVAALAIMLKLHGGFSLEMDIPPSGHLTLPTADETDKSSRVQWSLIPVGTSQCHNPNYSIPFWLGRANTSMLVQVVEAFVHNKAEFVIFGSNDIFFVLKKHTSTQYLVSDVFARDPSSPVFEAVLREISNAQKDSKVPPKLPVPSGSSASPPSTVETCLFSVAMALMVLDLDVTSAETGFEPPPEVQSAGPAAGESAVRLGVGDRSRDDGSGHADDNDDNDDHDNNHGLRYSNLDAHYHESVADDDAQGLTYRRAAGSKRQNEPSGGSTRPRTRARHDAQDTAVITDVSLTEKVIIPPIMMRHGIQVCPRSEYLRDIKPQQLTHPLMSEIDLSKLQWVLLSLPRPSRPPTPPIVSPEVGHEAGGREPPTPRTPTVDLTFPLKPEDRCGDTRLDIGKYLGSGRLWDVFDGSLTVSGVRHHVAAKFSIPGTFPICQDPEQVGYSTSETARKAVDRDAFFTSGPLAHLQGVCIPRYHGLYSTQIDGYPLIYMMITEYAGKVFIPGDTTILGGLEFVEPRLQQQVFAAFDKIHAAGIVHGDASAGNILYSKAKDRVTVVDFEGAEFATPHAIATEHRFLRRASEPFLTKRTG